MAQRIRTAVVGVGHFGQFHADKYASLDTGTEFVAVCDTDRARANAAAAKHGVRAVYDYRELLGNVDAVSIAVPTRSHHAVCKTFLENGVHVLVEKPIAHDLAAADDLARLAERRGVVLQVGHLERFSAAAQAIAAVIDRPLYVESSRIAPFQPRGTDTTVILDLMIHDIDLVLALVRAPVESVDAVGAPVLTGAEDIAATRLRFSTGCIANITASRVSVRHERKLRAFQPDTYVSIDFLAHEMAIVRKHDADPSTNAPRLDLDRRHYEEQDNLKREIAAFLECVATGSRPLVSGEDGRLAVEVAARIADSLRQHLDFVRSRYGDPFGARPAAGLPGDRQG
jgi:predicted dehydrogenase